MAEQYKPLLSGNEPSFNPMCNDLQAVRLTASGKQVSKVAEEGMRSFTEYRAGTGQLEPPENAGEGG